MCIRIKSPVAMSPFKSPIIFVCSFLLVACAHVPKQQLPQPAQPVQAGQAEQSDQADEAGQADESGQSDQLAQSPESQAGQVLPNIELSSQLLYEFLVSELASQRGYKDLAAEASTAMAEQTHDPRVAKRAAQLAFESGDMEKTIAAFKVWQSVDPTSTTATRLLSSVLLRSGKLDEAGVEFARILREDNAKVGSNFLEILQILSAYPDKTAALKLMRELAQPYPNVAEAHWVVAHMAQISGDTALAMSEVKQVRSLRKEWAAGVSLEAQLLQKESPTQALGVLRDYLSAYPKSREIRLQYARVLLDQKQFQQARAEFQLLANEMPDNAEMIFAVALISLQLNDFQDAEVQLKQALGKGKKEHDVVQYYLGQLSEAKKDEQQALEHYREVKGGEYRFAAATRVAYLLSKSGQLAEARQYLHQLQPDNNQQRVQLLIIEAQLLREANQLPEAYQVLQQGLLSMPNQIDLLYETAMLADMIGKPDVFEQLIRKLIQINPGYAHAYNALGYSLLGRNERLAEAMELVEKALQLAPNDPAIMDSVGWGYYRTGKLDDSIKILRRAYTLDPDPEIAAHLGEVLWVYGNSQEAEQIWQNSLKENPDNVPLRDVIKKFNP